MNPWIFAVLSAVSTGLAFLLASGPLTAVGGWLGVLLLLLCARTSRSVWPVFLSGILAHGIGFYWLVTTIAFFGKFPLVVATLIFALFVVTSSLSYLVFASLHRYAPAVLHRFALGAPLALLVAEFTPVRIFPWSFGHSQADFRLFAQLADIGGVAILSFFMAWCSEALVAIRSVGIRAAFPIAFFALSLVYGSIQLETFARPQGPQIPVMIAQANVSIEDKHNIMAFAKNTERYQTLTNQASHDGAFVIWPETVIQEWIPTSVGHVSRSKYLPRSSKPVSFLVGALTYDPVPYGETPTHMYNSAIAIYGNGAVPTPYHKQILMPFGEYMPLGTTFPWLRTISGVLGDFTAGADVSVFNYPAVASTSAFSASALVCYEDIIPGLARRSAAKGAELLVNITNDAWFGNSRAPFQHHLLALFRAIETRRYLIRSTNTGLTAIVSPIGETVATLPIFDEGTLLASVEAIRYKTVYTQVGDLPWWILCCLTVVFAARNFILNRRTV